MVTNMTSLPGATMGTYNPNPKPVSSTPKVYTYEDMLNMLDDEAIQAINTLPEPQNWQYVSDPNSTSLSLISPTGEKIGETNWDALEKYFPQQQAEPVQEINPVEQMFYDWVYEYGQDLDLILSNPYDNILAEQRGITKEQIDQYLRQAMGLPDYTLQELEANRLEGLGLENAAYPIYLGEMPQAPPQEQMGLEQSNYPLSGFGTLEEYYTATPTPINIQNAIQHIFWEYSDIVTKDTEQAINYLRAASLDDPEGFIDFVIQKGGTGVETNVLLQAVFPQLTKEQIEGEFGYREAIEQITPLFHRIFPKLADVESMINLFRKNPELYKTTMGNVGYTQDIGMLTKILYPEMSDQDIWEIFHGEYDKGWFGKLWDSFKAGAGDFQASVGSALEWAATKMPAGWMGLDFLGTTTREAGETWQSALPPDQGIGWDFARSLPTTLWIMTVSLGVGGAIPTVARLGTFGNYVLKTLGMAAVSRPLESALEAGGTYTQALSLGYSREEASRMATETFGRNMQLYGLDALEFGTALLPFARAGSPVVKSLVRKGLVTTAKEATLSIAGTALTEAGEEYYQQIIQMQALGEDVSAWAIINNLTNAEIRQVTILGAMSGGAFAGTSNIISIVQNITGKNLPPDIGESLRKDIADGLRAGKTEQQAINDAFEKIANNKEVQAVIDKVLPVAEVAWYKNLIEATDPIRAQQLTDKFTETVNASGLAYTVDPVIGYSPRAEISRTARMQKGYGWREAFDESDIYKKSDILSAFANSEGVTVQELHDIIDRVSGLPNESNIRWAVKEKLKSYGEEDFSGYDEFQAKLESGEAQPQYNFEMVGERKYSNSEMFTVTFGGKRIGSVDYDITKPTKKARKEGAKPIITITDIKVNEEYRRMGIATELVRQIAQKYPGVKMKTNKQLELGEKLFQKLGIGTGWEGSLPVFEEKIDLTLEGQEVPVDEGARLFPRVWEGKAYRVESENMGIPSDATVGDIIRFEEEELENEYNLSPEQMAYLDRFHAYDAVWVGRTKDEVREYLYEGQPESAIQERTDIPEGSRIIVGEEGEGIGYLVLYADAEPITKAEIPTETITEEGVQPDFFGGETRVTPVSKGEVTQMGMDDYMKYQQAMQPDIIEAQDEAIPEEFQEAYEAQARIDWIEEFLASDPVANWRTEQTVVRKGKEGKEGKQFQRKVGLESFLFKGEGEFPQHLTLKQSRQINAKLKLDEFSQPGTPEYNKVPSYIVLDELASSWNMTTDELANRIVEIRNMRRELKDLNTKINRVMRDAPIKGRKGKTTKELKAMSETPVPYRYSYEEGLAISGFYREYINSDNALTAHELFMSLKSKTSAERASNWYARKEELIAEGNSYEDAAFQAMKDELSGKYPVITDDFLDEVNTDLRSAMFSVIEHHPILSQRRFRWEQISAYAALQKALDAKTPPTRKRGRPEPGSPTSELFPEGGSQWDRLMFIFSENPQIPEAIDKMASKGKDTESVVVDMLDHMDMEYEGGTWKSKKEGTDITFKLSDDPVVRIFEKELEYEGQIHMFEREYNLPADVEDLRSNAEKAYGKNTLELRILLAEKQITQDQFDIFMKAEEEKLRGIERITGKYSFSYWAQSQEGNLELFEKYQQLQLGEEPYIKPESKPVKSKREIELETELLRIKLQEPSKLKEEVIVRYEPKDIPLRQEDFTQVQQLSMLEEKFEFKPPTDDRPLNDRTYSQEMLDLRIQRAEGKINEDEFKLKAFEIRDKNYPPPPTPRFPKPVSDAFEEPQYSKPRLPNMELTDPEKQIIVDVLKGIGWTAVDIGNFLRANKASVDFSFWRQTAMLAPGHPLNFYRANVEAWKAMFSEQHAEANWAWITSDPDYEIYEAIRKRIGADPLRPFVPRKGSKQWEATEEFGYAKGAERLIPRITRKLPWIKISQRSFETGCNTMVWLTWKTYLKDARIREQNIANGTIKLPSGQAFSLENEMIDFQRMLADMVQRANISAIGEAAPALSVVTFAPRAAVGRFLSPRHLLTGNPRARKAAWRNLGSFVAVNSSILMLGAFLGFWDVDWNPQSGEFASIRVGNTRIDPWAGYKQFATFFTRVVSGTGISSVTGATYDINPINEIQNFLTSKASPFSSFFLDLLRGQTWPEGEEFDITNIGQQIERLIPFMIMDVYEAARDNAAMGLITALPAWVGFGVNTYTGDWNKAWNKKGEGKYPDNLRWGVTDPYWDLADIWSDFVPDFKGVDPNSLSKDRGFPEWLKFMVETDRLLDEVELITNDSLISLNADSSKGYTFVDFYDMWTEYQAAGDKDKWLEDNPGAKNYFKYGNMTAREFSLLKEYHTLKTDDERSEFLDKHPELSVKRRDEWLRTHAKENAELAFWGRYKIMSREALSLLNNLIAKYDIPDTAIVPGMAPPAEYADDYFDYQDLLREHSASSSEALLFLLEHDEFRDWAGYKKPDNNIEVLKINVKYRDQFAEYNALENDADRRQYKIDHPEFHQAMIEKDWYGMEEATISYFEELGRPVPEGFKDLYMEYRNKVFEYKANSFEVKLFKLQNPDFYLWGKDEDTMGWQTIDSGNMTPETYIKYLELKVKYRHEDEVYDSFKTKALTTKQLDNWRKAYLIENPEYAIARIQVEAYQKGIPDQWIDTFIEYKQADLSGNQRTRWLWNHYDFFQAVREIMDWAPLTDLATPTGGYYGLPYSGGLPGMRWIPAGY